MTAAPRVSLDLVLDAARVRGLKVTGRGARFKVQCPAHDDAAPSLGVSWAAGRALLKCYAGCSTPAVVEALGLAMTDLYDAPLPPREDRTAPLGRPARSRGPGLSAPARTAVAAHPVAAVGDRSPEPAVEINAGGCRAHSFVSDPESRLTAAQVAAVAAAVGSATADYRYTDAAGQVLAVKRRRPVKRFSWAKPDGTAGGIDESALPLYRLPAVLAAAGRGELVVIVEGEKDADALAAAGECGSTFGSVSGPITDDRLETLKGAHVVLVADRDPAGYRRAGELLAALAPVAACVTVVEAATGKDAADHLAAGLAPGALVQVTRGQLPDWAASSDHDPAGEEDGPDAQVVPLRPGQRTGPRVNYATERKRQEFLAYPDALVEVKLVKRGDEWEETEEEVLTARARLVAYVERETVHGGESRATHAALEVSRGDDALELTVDLDELADLTWVTEANRRKGWDVDYTRTSRGRGTVLSAIVRTSGVVANRVEYARPDWVEVPDPDGGPARWVLADADGGIGAEGRVELWTALAEEVSGVRFPAPAITPQEADRAFRASTFLAGTVTGGRIAVPLLGAAYRALLGKVNALVYLRGGTRSGKSGAAAYALQHYQPQARFDVLPVGVSADDATPTGLEGAMWSQGSTLAVYDDVNPDKGQAVAQERAAMVARAWFAGRGKLRGRREGGNRRTLRYSGAAVVTGEDVPSVESAETRLVYVWMKPGDLAFADLAAADRDGGPEERARWTATLARYAAPRLPELRTWIVEQEARYAGALCALGVNDRTARSVSQLAGGWRFALRVAVETGAVDEAKARRVWRGVWDVLADLGRGQDAALEDRTLVARIREGLVGALQSGRAHLRDRRTGGVPVADPNRWGWWEDRTGGRPNVPTYDDGRTLTAKGTAIGFVDDAGVYLEPGPTRQVLEDQTRGEGEPLGLSARALAAALADERLTTGLRVEQGSREHYAPWVLTGTAGRLRLWHLDARWLYPGEDGTRSDTPTPIPPGTSAAALWDDPQPEAPSAPPARVELAEPVGVELVEPVDVELVEPVDVELVEPVGVELVEPTTPGPALALSAVPSQVLVGLVLDVDGSSAVIRSDDVPSTVAALPAGAWADLPTFLGCAAELIGNPHSRRPVQLWLTAAATARLGLPPQEPPAARPRRETRWEDDDPAVGAARAAGWSVKPTGAWLRAWRDGGRTLTVVLAGWLREDDHPLLAGAVTPGELAGRLSRWARHVPAAYRITPAVTGVDLVEELKRNGRGARLTAAIEPCPPARLGPQVDRTYSWSRRPYGDEVCRAYVHSYDRNAQYVGAAGGAQLGMVAARHVDRPTFDASLPGYWRLDPGEPGDLALPDPAGQRSIRVGQGPRWLTTPAVAYLVERGYAVDPLEAWVYGESARYLEGWAAAWSRARGALLESTDPADRAVLATTKRAYAGAIGRFAAPTAAGQALYRPDWHHAIESAARVNLHRTVTAVRERDGLAPLVVWRDLVVYASDNPDPIAGAPPSLPLSAQVGKFKPQDTARAGPVLELLDQGAPVDRVLEALRACGDAQ